MRKSRLSYFYKSVIFAVSMLFFCISYAQSSGSHSTAVTPPSAVNTPTVDALNTNSFADVAALGQEIAIAQRKIQAMTLKNSLDALEAQQNMGTISLKVLRVEGFGNTLYAILSDETGAIYQVGPGDVINKQYRVVLLRPYSVGVVDVNTERYYMLPFVMGRVNTSVNDNSATASSQPSDESAATSAAS